MDELPDETGQELERNFVKQTYDHIAEDFSSTRHKRWPKVDNFIRDLPTNSLLLDVGCGNGKYLDVPSGFSLGCDISQNLLSICKSRGFEVVLCDMTRLPFREGIFDTVICVAALHHIVASHRRQKCLEGIVKTLSENSAKLLVQVWAYEQKIDRDNPYLKKNPQESMPASREELQIDDCLIMPVHVNRTPFLEQDILVPFSTKSGKDRNDVGGRHLRYYHVFMEKELDKMFERIEGIKIDDSYYDRGNWCIVASRLFQGNDEDQT